MHLNERHCLLEQTSETGLAPISQLIEEICYRFNLKGQHIHHPFHKTLSFL